MTLKNDYDNVDGEFKHLIAGSDEEILQLEQAARPLRLDLPQTGPDLSPAESATLRDRIETNGLVREVLGVDSPSVLQVDATPLGANGKPLGKLDSTAQLESSFKRLIDAVIKGVANGDPEALEIVSRNRPSVPPLIKRMAERADEFAPAMSPFVKAWADNDRTGMRAAVRELRLAEI